MATTLADLLANTREHLASWGIPGLLEGSIDARTDSLRIQESLLSGFIGQKALIEVEDEVMLAVLVPDETSTIKVIRGFQGTTAAPHLAGVAYSIHPAWGWTDRTLRRHINKAILWCRPHSWTQVTGTAFTWAANYYTATPDVADGISYPYGNYIIRLECADTGQGVTNYIPFHSWQLNGSTLRFRNAAGTSRTLRPIIAKMQPQLTVLTTALDDDIYAEAIECYAAHLAFNSLKSNRVRFTEYSAALNDRSATPDELVRIAFDLKNQAQVARENFIRPLPANYVSTYRDP